uniref:RNA-directed RNA polymerase n=1 Tax=Orthopteran chu-related virus OKIAV152 TaxID=2792595 RepID=A0A7T0M3H5_9VIRU|nr:RNA-dependent RNA polymerase [Orthopteran chu-related virus OKIAV152]
MFMSQSKVSFETPMSAIYERKFDTAIRSSFSKEFHARMLNETLTLDDRLIVESKHISYKTGPVFETPDAYADLLLLLFSNDASTTSYSNIRKQVQRNYSLTQDLVKIQISYILQSNYTYLRKRVQTLADRHLTNIEPRPELVRLINMSIWLIEIIEKINTVHAPKYQRLNDNDKLNELLKINHATCPYISLSMVWSYTKCLLMISGKKYLLPRTFILLLHNKICDLISVLTLALYGEGTCYAEGSYTLTLDFVKELCRLILKYQNKAFDILKCLEGLGIAETLVEVENWRNTEFLDVLADDLYASTRFNYLASHLRALLTAADIPMRHELMCLSKIVGHPLVDMEEGSIALHKATTEELDINLTYVHQCVCYIKQNYIRNHIQKEGRWPPAQINSKDAPHPLVRAFVMNLDPHCQYILTKFGEVRIEDYTYIDILPNMQYNKLENSIPYLKDKTISVLRSKVMTNYIQATGQGMQEKHAQQTWAETRCLLAFLIHPSSYHNHIKFMDRVAYSHTLTNLLDYLVIRVVPKEKELKVLYRGYGCKTYEYRLGTLAQEKNVMRFLDEFSNEQAMTLSELELLKRLRAFRSLYKAYPGYTVLYVVLDSSKWNNKFRPETVDWPMKHTLDKVFDYPIFGKTHETYKKSIIYVPDGDDVYWWDGQAGGIEGQNQDTWVVTYLAQLKVALHGLNIKYHILCKGDDVRIVIAIPNRVLEHTPIGKMKNIIVKRISDKMAGFGHIIKLEESYGSCKYFAFSKSASCEHIELPQGFRKIQKCYGANNAFIPTLDEYIASTFSNAHSSCKTEPIVIPSYSVAAFWSFYYMMNHPKYKDMADNEYLALLLTPSIVGGFPVIYLHNMHVRAESDLLSPFIGIFQHCRKYAPDVAEVMEHFLHVPTPEEEDLNMLFRDPYCLPSDRPRLPSAVLRSLIVPALETISQNKDLLQLIRVSRSPEHDNLMMLLRSADVFNVRVLSVMFAGSPAGILEELLRKFESSRSIIELVILRYGRRRAERRIRVVMRAENMVQSWRAKRVKGKNLQYCVPLIRQITDCPSESAYKIRAYAWKREIEGITMPPLQHQLEFHIALSSPDNRWINNNHFTFKVLKPDINIGRRYSEHYAARKTEPFVGYTTRTGNIAPSAHFIEKDPILTKMKNLFDLGSWVTGSKVGEDGEILESNANEVIDLILQSYTDIPRKDIDPFVAKKKSGTVQHHLRSPSFRESIVPNVLSNMYTRFSGESDTHVTLFHSKSHYRVNFLHCFCYAAWCLMMELEFSSVVTTPHLIWGVTTPCEFCNEPIEEKAIMFDQRLLRSVSLEPLSLIRIGEVAEEILKKSVHAWYQKNIRYELDQDALSYQIGIIGVLQELTDKTYFQRRSIENRHGGYHLDLTSYSIISNLSLQKSPRDVGLTEIKRMAVSRIGSFLVSIIAPLFEQLACHADPDEFEVFMASCPYSELPWYGLMQQFYRAGILAPLIRWFHSESRIPPPVCYYNPQTASSYVGRAALHLYDHKDYEHVCVVLSYYNNGILERHLSYYSRYILWKAYMKLFRQYFHSLPFSKAEEYIDNVIALLRQSCLIWYMYEATRESITQASKSILERQEQEVYLPDYYDFDVDDLLEVIELSPNSRFRTSILGYCEKYKLKPEVVMDIQEQTVADFLITCNNSRAMFSIKLAYTTLELCIATIRSHGGQEIEEDRLEEDEEPYEEETPAQLEYRLNKVLPDISVDYRPRLIDPVAVNYVPHIAMLDIQTYAVDQKEMYRILGWSNGSETYIVSVLEDTGISSQLPPLGNYACIADGDGGACSVLAYFTHAQCTLLYHTLLENRAGEILPNSLLNIFPNMQKQLLASHLEEGYDDLMQIATWERFEQYNKVYSGMILELELQNHDLSKYNLIYMHMATFFLRNRLHGSFLIARVNLYSSINADCLVSRLASYCTYIQVYRPRCMKRYKWAYIIAAGYRQEFTDTYSDILCIVDPGISQRTLTMQRRLVEYMEEWAPERGFPHVLDIPDTSTYVRKLDLMPSRAQANIRNEVGLDLIFSPGESFIDMITILMSNWSTSTLSKYNLSVGAKLFKWIERLNKDDLPHLYDKQSWTTDTQAHRLICLNSMFCLAGFYYGMQSFVNIETPLVLDHEDYLKFYQSILNLLPERDRYGGNAREHFDGHFSYKGRRIITQCMYIRGINTFLNLYGTMVGFYKMQGSAITGKKKDKQRRKEKR